MSRACSTCGSSDIDFDPSRGDTVCTNCGSVLEESVIVSEVTFQDNSAGGSSVIGQFVSNEGNKVGQGLGFRSGFGRESRTVTLENGKRRLQALASQLQLNNHCVESAYMFLKLAVSKRLTKGRRTNHVAAACLYLVCRTEKTPHLLIDFSDLLQVDVMVLGKIFLKLQHELCINLPVIDPCLYIHRFSHQLQLEDKEQEVTNTALRLVSRMKRDWLQYGRRPSGLCGAALLVAARLHGFRRTVKEIVKVVRLSVTTVRKRLSEFKKTPSGQLTVDQFNNIDLEEEQDPPSFTSGRQRLKQQQLDEFNAINKPALAKELEDLRREIEKVLDKTKTKTLETAKLDTAAPPEAKITNEENFGNSLNNEVAEVSNESVCDNEPASNLSTDNTETTVSDKPCEENIVTDKDVGEVDDNREKEDNGNLEEEVTNENCNGKISEDKEILNTTNEDDEVKGGNDEAQSTQDAKDVVDGLDDLDDDELDGLILTAPEVEVKTKVWMEENKDYLEKLKEKEEREAKEREDGDQNKKKRRKPYKKRTKEQANSVGEAVEKMLIEKKISNKINYDVLRNLNRENELEKPSKQEELESTTSAPVSSLLQAVQTSIPIRYKGRKRDKNILPHLPTKRVKFSDSVTEQEVPGDVGTNAVPSVHAESNNVTTEESVLVESGPVEYDDHDQECMDDEDDEDVHLSAAQLMGQYGQVDLEEFGDFDAY